MQKMKAFFLWSYCLLINGTVSPVFSQYNTTIGKVSISSPNAASLGKFGDIPVSTHTGIPNIDVPIYTIQSGPLELPINLGYHASGLKVQEQASWVGAGWALEAGGVITRTVVGAADDRGLNSAYTTKGHFADYGYNSYLFSPGPLQCPLDPPVCAAGRTGMPPSANGPQDTYIQTGIFDGEPDLYFFNFAGHSGKFYFNDDRTPMIVPEQDLKIVPIYTGTDWRGITGFIITTPDGVQYYFGQNPLSDGNPDALEITYDVTTQMQYTGQGATSAWYLNRIVSADGLFSISLIYQADSYAYYTLSMYPIPATPNPNWFSYINEYDIDKNYIDGVRLSKIVFANGEVDFNAGSLRQDLSKGTGAFPNYNNVGLTDIANTDTTLGARALGSISIKANSLCKNFTFYTSYFFDNTPLTAKVLTVSYPQFTPTCDEYRLRLDSVKETSCDGYLAKPPYKFSYFTGTVPRKLSFGIDHWGFYNGVNTNTTLIPTYTLTPPAGLPGQITTVTGGDRDTHWPNCLGGTLQQITYPTGGTTSFVFESNDVYTAIPIYTKTTIPPTLVTGFGSTVTNPAPFTTDGSTNTYELDMSSNQPAGEIGGTLEFFVNGGQTNNFSVTAGQSNSTFFTLTPSTTYTSTFFDNNNGGPISGNGINATLSELIPTTIYSNTPVGGIRIKTITNNDGLTSTNVVTSYNYTYDNTPGGQSSGILFSVPIYVQALRNDAWAQVVGASCSIYGCFYCQSAGAAYYQSPSSIRPMSTTQGNHIGYGEVFVSQSGNGYTDNRFYSTNGAIPHKFDPPITDVCVRTISTYCDPSIPNSPAPPLPYDPMRGELNVRASYSQTNQLLKSQTSIPAYQFDPMLTPGTMCRFFVTGYMAPPADDPDVEDPTTLIPQFGVIPIGVNTITEYTLQTAKKIRDSIITTTYDPSNGNFLTDIKTTYYGSAYHTEPSQTITYTSKGDKILTNYKNAFDYRISNFAVADQLPTYTSNINSDNSYLATALNNITLLPSDPNYPIHRLDTFTNYRYMKAIDRQTYLQYRLTNFMNTTNTYKTDHDAAKTAANTELKPILEAQDEYKDPVLERTTWINNSLMQSEFTRFDYALSPANIVYPNKTQLVDLQAPSSSFTSSAVSGNTLVKDSRYADEVTYNFKAGNPQQNTAHDGIVNMFIWDYLNTEPIAKVTSGYMDTVAYTSFEADGSGNWTIQTTRSRIDTFSSLTGKREYWLTDTPVIKSGLTSTNSYIVSYWSRTGSNYNIPSSTSIKQGKTVFINNQFWTYFEHVVTGTTSVAVNSITGGGYIDELRLYPINAQMTTYSYNPLVGITNICDVANRVTYYVYDGLGRLKWVKDQDGNLIKTIQYHYKSIPGIFF
jgi:hypothetical protein